MHYTFVLVAISNIGTRDVNLEFKLYFSENSSLNYLDPDAEVQNTYNSYLKANVSVLRSLTIYVPEDVKYSTSYYLIMWAQGSEMSFYTGTSTDWIPLTAKLTIKSSNGCVK